MEWEDALGDPLRDSLGASHRGSPGGSLYDLPWGPPGGPPRLRWGIPRKIPCDYLEDLLEGPLVGTLGVPLVIYDFMEALCGLCE